MNLLLLLAGPTPWAVQRILVTLRPLHGDAPAASRLGEAGLPGLRHALVARGPVSAERKRRKVPLRRLDHAFHPARFLFHPAFSFWSKGLFGPLHSGNIHNICGEDMTVSGKCRIGFEKEEGGAGQIRMVEIRRP